jgi:hypothetical protein
MHFILLYEISYFSVLQFAYVNSWNKPEDGSLACAETRRLKYKKTLFNKQPS